MNIDKKYHKYLSILLITIIISTYLFLFLKRVVYPDNSFDTLNYHFFLGKNGFENFPLAFKTSEFYPLGIHSFNPLIDIIGHVGYLILGYRLGTILSLLSLAGVVILGIQLFKKSVETKFTIFSLLLILPAFIVNEGIFQIGTYFTDNIYSFLIALYIFILFKFIDTEKEKIRITLALFLGLIGGLIFTKLTNVVYVVPLFILTVYFICQKYQEDEKINIKKIFIPILLYALIVVCVNFFVFIDAYQTGNPVFPYYNEIFKSIYYPQTSWSFNFGPVTTMQRIFYPFYVIRNPVLLGEVKDMFPDLKLFIIFFYTLLTFLFFKYKKQKFNKYEGSLIFIFFLSFFLWQIQFGYSRYAIFLEILGGMLSAIFALRIFSEKKKWGVFKVLTVVYIILIVFQSWRIIAFNYKYDISWRPTPTFFEWRNILFSPMIFQKYTNINSDTNDILKDTDIIIQCINPSSVYFSTIKEIKDLPMLNFDQQSNGFMTLDTDFSLKRDYNYQNFSGRSFGTLRFISAFNMKHAFIGKEEEICRNALSKQKNINIDGRFEINNFIGDENDTLILLTGTYQINK